jgi:hypothetical protein
MTQHGLPRMLLVYWPEYEICNGPTRHCLQRYLYHVITGEPHLLIRIPADSILVKQPDFAVAKSTPTWTGMASG